MKTTGQSLTSLTPLSLFLSSAPATNPDDRRPATISEDWRHATIPDDERHATIAAAAAVAYSSRGSSRIS
ncbi:hypothetical protein RDI58_020036 [Solanum bulbocastanum]|uniref:Secreted protein n=1 Tax=Solanum bulbocastanum TaxID=147425 RepID=A0AAN8T5V4_SOLBU